MPITSNRSSLGCSRSSTAVVASDIQSQIPTKSKKPLTQSKRRKNNGMDQINNAAPLIFDNCSMASKPQVSILLTHSYASFNQKL